MNPPTHNSDAPPHLPPSRGRPSRLIAQAAPARPVSTSPAPHQHSQSPFRYVHFEQSSSEKQRLGETNHDQFSGSRSNRLDSLSSASPSQTFSQPSSSRPSSSRRNSPACRPTMRLSPPDSANMFASPHPSLHCNHPHARRLRLHSLLRPWLPLILYLCTSLGFLLAIAFWKEEVFRGTYIPAIYISFYHPSESAVTAFRILMYMWRRIIGLDDLSKWLKEDESFGYCVLFILIFLTCFRTYSQLNLQNPSED